MLARLCVRVHVCMQLCVCMCVCVCVLSVCVCLFVRCVWFINIHTDVVCCHHSQIEAHYIYYIYIIIFICVRVCVCVSIHLVERHHWHFALLRLLLQKAFQLGVNLLANTDGWMTKEGAKLLDSFP